jgi:hypothetical protein
MAIAKIRRKIRVKVIQRRVAAQIDLSPACPACGRKSEPDQKPADEEPRRILKTLIEQFHFHRNSTD